MIQKIKNTVKKIFEIHDCQKFKKKIGSKIILTSTFKNKNELIIYKCEKCGKIL